MLKVLAFLGALSFFFLSSSFASSDTTNDDGIAVEILKANFPGFATDAGKLKMPTRYIDEAINALRGVVFKDNFGASALYDVNANIIYFETRLKDKTTGYLKRLAELGSQDVGSVYHELWHCFFFKVAPYKYDLFLREFKKTANSLYGKYPSASRSEIQEEAYAAFIEGSLTTYLTLKKYSLSLNEEDYQKFLLNERFKKTYDSVFAEKYYGYYHSFWGGDLEYSDIPMRESDKIIILTELFDKVIKRDFKEAFDQRELYPNMPLNIDIEILESITLPVFL